VKPAPFEYHSPETVEAALALLDRHREEAKVLAGGQSLIPLLNFRLARPEHVVDLNGLTDLSYVRRAGGSLHIGALTRQSVLERSGVVSKHCPILSEAVGLVAHAQIRSRGTIGGSVAHADPAAELPVAFAALDARFELCSTRGTRKVGWKDFFRTHMTTALEVDELLVEIEVPPLPARTGHAFLEFAPRQGDFALGGAAALVTLDRDGSCERAAVALLGAAPTPVRSPEAEAAVVGTTLDERTCAAASCAAVASVEPTGDIHGSSAYRRELIETLVARALASAADRARHAPR
jgi:carbon-monoxide dehydrogenase medium subunit/6-hydroxypseudooxynicotine dehydrogenase subunit alpha